MAVVIDPVIELSLSTSPNYNGNILTLSAEEQQALSDEFIAHQRLFGFQSDNIRNQYEHLCFLIQNTRDRYGEHAYQYLHNRIFANYKKWVNHINAQRWCFQKTIRSPFNEPSYGDRNKVQDLVLWLCIWGEAANLRHMPEYLCFLFFRMSQQRAKVIESGSMEIDHSQDEWFRCKVIEPAYYVAQALQIYQRNNQTLKDHSKRPNYDDLNEYFWNRKWLDEGKNFHLDDKVNFWGLKFIQNTIDFDDKLNKPVAVQREGTMKERNRKDANRLKMKTFIEKRSWLNLWRSFSRIVELHLFALHILILFAYNQGTNLQYLFTAVLTPAGLCVINELLEVYFYWGVIWQLGLFLNLLIRLAIHTGIFLVLFYLFYFVSSSTNLFLYAAGAYLLLRIAFEMINIPSWRWIRKWHLAEDRNLESEISSQLGCRRFIQSVFWILLFATKCIYSYYSYILPIVELSDTILLIPGWAGVRGLARYNNTSNSNYILVILMWIPTIIIFLIDTQIFYSIAIVIVGLFLGVRERVSYVRSWADIQRRWTESWRNGSRKFFSRDSMNLINTLQASSAYEKPRAPLFLPPLQTPPWHMISVLWRNIVEEMRCSDMISYHDEQLLHFGHYLYVDPHNPNANNGQQNEYFFLPAMVTSGQLASFIELIGALQDAKLRHLGGQQFVMKEIRNALIHNETTRVALDEIYIASTLLMHIYIENCPFRLEGGNKLLDYIARQKQPFTFASEIVKTLTTLVQECVAVCFDKGYQNIIRKRPAPGEKIEIAPERVNEVNTKAFSTAMNNLYKLWVKIVTAAENNNTNNPAAAQQQSIQYPESATVLVERLDEVEVNGTAILLRVLYHLILTPAVDARPHNPVITDRLMFFLSSLSSHMPDRQNSIKEMYSWTVLTPYVDELVIYTEEELSKPNSDGVTAEFYLQSTHKKEWLNFLERMESDPRGGDPSYKLQQKREWCSYRGQTLLRTVRGMMFYEKATRLLALLEMGKGGMTTTEQQDLATAIARRKFQYVLSCQRYGQFMVAREKRDKGELVDRRQLPETTRVERRKLMDEAQKADDIEYIMKKWPHLRVAYVDDRFDQGQKIYYSVLVKAEEVDMDENQILDNLQTPVINKTMKEYGAGGGIVEVYRIRLPGTILVGEGKPENQNHALIFTRGEFTEAIDMNQDNYFEEALKMRNLLEEFDPLRIHSTGSQHKDEILRPNPCKSRNPLVNGHLKCAILGFREHIFTANLMSVGTYMSLMEHTFVSITLRAFAFFSARMHYGHPDLMDKLFFMTRGGVSKASKMLHVSEDIFAGYKTTLRGGRIFHREYIQCGKGRDLGFNQLFLFEAKLASGAGEQALSREAYRLGKYLDLPRLLSLFYGSIGFYTTTTLMVCSVFLLLFARVLIAMTGVNAFLYSFSNAFGISQSVISSSSIFQLGLLLSLPMLAEIALEKTFSKAISTFCWMLFTGSPLFFFFHMQTKAFFFNNSILFGGAKYRATGRGFVLTRDSFSRIYRNFARTHIYPSMKILFLLIVYGIFQTRGSWFRDCWAALFLMLSWLFAPLWFNPLSFDHDKVLSDFTEWRKWLHRISSSEENSWQAWWITEHEYLNRIPNATRRWLALFNIVVPGFLIVAAISSLQAQNVDRVLFLIISFGGTVGVILFGILILYKCKPIGDTWRYVKFLIALIIIGFFVFVLVFNPRGTASSAGENVVVYLIVLILTFNAACKIMVLYGAGPFRFSFVLHWFRFCDSLFGLIIYIPWLVLSFTGVMNSIQTRLLYNRAFFKGLKVKELLHGDNSQSRQKQIYHDIQPVSIDEIAMKPHSNPMYHPIKNDLYSNTPGAVSRRLSKGGDESSIKRGSPRLNSRNQIAPIAGYSNHGSADNSRRNSFNNNSSNNNNGQQRFEQYEAKQPYQSTAGSSRSEVYTYAPASGVYRGAQMPHYTTEAEREEKQQAGKYIEMQKDY